MNRADQIADAIRRGEDFEDERTWDELPEASREGWRRRAAPVLPVVERHVARGETQAIKRAEYAEREREAREAREHDRIGAGKARAGGLRQAADQLRALLDCEQMGADDV